MKQLFAKLAFWIVALTCTLWALPSHAYTVYFNGGNESAIYYYAFDSSGNNTDFQSASRLVSNSSIWVATFDNKYNDGVIFLKAKNWDNGSKLTGNCPVNDGNLYSSTDNNGTSNWLYLAGNPANDDWDNGVAMSRNGLTFTTTIKVGANQTSYFRFHNGEAQFGPASSSTAASTTGTTTLTNGNKTHSWYIKNDDNYEKTYDIAVNLSSKNFTVTQKTTAVTDLYIRGAMNSWESSDDWKFNYNSSSQEYTINCTINPDISFKFGDSSSKFSTYNFGYNKGAMNPEGSYTLDTNGSDITLSKGFTGTITVKITNGVATVKFGTNSFDNGSTGGNTGEYHESDVMLFGDFSAVGFTPFPGWQNDWYYSQGMTQTEDPNIYTYVIDPEKTGKAYLRFKIRNNGTDTYYEPNAGNSNYKEVYLEKNGTKSLDHDNAKAKSYSGDQKNDATACWYLDVHDAGKLYKIIVKKEHSGFKQIVCEVMDKPFTGPNLSNDRTRAGKVYLVGEVINNNVPSPAWEMVKNGSTWNLGEFAMRRNSHIGVVVYSATGVPQYYEMTDKVNQPTENVGGAWKDKIYSYAGWTYTASWDGSTLTLNPTTFSLSNGILPYIGILGQKFVQSTSYPTSRKDQNTQKGWQEAYIEYGANGAPVLMSDGKTAYYNTVWPPRHNILLQAQMDVNGKTDLLNVTSSELSLQPDAAGTKSAADWKKDLKAKYPDRNYDNLNLPSGNYMRYVVDNMWMQGDFKIWTGWGGQEASWGANWDTHIYWGPTSNADSYEVDKIKAHQLYSTTNEGSDYNFKSSSRSFYGSMELFIPVDANNGFKFTDAKLYVTEAPGGASIDAKADADKNVYYAPSLTSWPTGDYKVTSYTITRYEYNPEVKSNEFAAKLRPCDKKNNRVSYSNAKVASKTYTYDDGLINQDAFSALFAKDLEDKFTSNGVYGDGLYIFRLEVTFTDKSGKVQKADVWSPYVEIIDNNYNVGLDVYQLIQLPGGNKITSEYGYVVYDEDLNCRVVNLDNEGKFVSYADLVDIDTDELQNIYENTGTWTNRVLLVSQNPYNFNKQGKARTSTISVDAYDLQLTNVDPTDDESLHMGVLNLATPIVHKTFDPIFEGEITRFDDETLTLSSTNNRDVVHTTSANYMPTFILPGFGTASLSFDEGKSQQTGETVMDFTASHQDLNFTDDDDDDDNDGMQQRNVTTNRHMLQADIQVIMPNVEEAIREDLYSNLIMSINNCQITGIDKNKDAASFGLSYKYQNPYDWMELVGKEWKGINKSWSMNAFYNPGEMRGVMRTLLADGSKVENYTPFVASITANPHFTKPVVNKDKDNLKFSFDFPRLQTGYFDLYLDNMEISVNNIDADDLNPDDDNNTGFTQDSNSVFLLKLTSSKNNVDYVSRVMDYDGKSISWDKPILSMQVAKSADNFTFPDITEVLTDLQVEVAYAYYFSAGGEAGYKGDDGDNFDAAASTSGWVGFEGDFPYMRDDHQTPSTQNAPRRVESDDSGYPKTSDDMDDPKSALMKGDNAFLLAPVYEVVKVNGEANMEEIGMPTGVEDIDAEATANIIAGKGFINLNGHEGMIYVADGRMVYFGAGRADLAQGVYVVKFGSHSVKVFVK